MFFTGEVPVSLSQVPGATARTCTYCEATNLIWATPVTEVVAVAISRQSVSLFRMI